MTMLECKAGILAAVFAAFMICSVLEAADVWPTSGWQAATPAEMGMDQAKLDQARTYALTGGGSGHITRGGKLVMLWGSATQRYDLKSSTKSIGITSLGLAIKDGKMGLDDKAQQYHTSLGVPPASNTATGWLDDITVKHLATQTAGFDKSGGYTSLIFQTGTRWAYSDGGPNWLAECITLQYSQDLRTLMFDRVFTPLGITSSDLTWRNNAYRPTTIGGVANREFGSGINANVNAMARIGYLYLRGGKWESTQIIPQSFVNTVRTAQPGVTGLPVNLPGSYFNASDHYGLLWWNNADGTLANVPRDAYWSWGLYDSFIIVIPSLDIVASRAGSGWRGGFSADYNVLKPFIEPICQSVMNGAPYGPSPVITNFTWAGSSTIVRKASGSDNWPCTWGDDDELYTAYGDGWGFVPKVPNKLSLGFAKVSGDSTNFTGTNIRSATGEQTGDGSNGKKGSGIIMVDGTLYMWVRNALAGRESQLAWSTDHGATWTWNSWRFAELGYCTFINYGKNNAGARDGYVYAVSHDNPSAYNPADRFILMRVPKDKIRNRSDYEFLRSVDGDANPVWTADFAQRGSVFDNPGECRRSGISYDAGLGRYLWWQGIPHAGDERAEGGFGVYDAPEPWGPWTTAYFTPDWDVGPGETGNFPTKWMSADGKTIHLVFSGNDCFSVRKATLTVAGGPPQNGSPTVDAGPDRAVTLPAGASLDGTVSDPDGDNLTTTWSKQFGPGNVSFGNASAVDTTATFSVAGAYVLKLTANDGNNPDVSDTMTVTVSPEPPATPSAPASLSAATVSDTRIDLSWTDNSSNESGFRIERATGSGGGALSVVIKTYNSTNNAPTIEAAGTADSFKVGAQQVNDRAVTWSEVPAALDGEMRMLCARNDKADAGYNSLYVVTLSAPAAVYAVISPEYGTSPMPFMDATWTDTGMTAKYSTSPTALFHIWKKDAAAGDLTLGADDDGSKQGACYVFVGGANFAEIATVGAGVESHADNGLSAETEYTYRIRAYNGAGNSAYSNEDSATTDAAPVTDVDPVVYFTNPGDNDTVSGAISVNAHGHDANIGIADGDGIDHVTFELVDSGSVVATTAEYVVTYDWSLDTTAHGDGSYILRATAYATGAAGGTSSMVEIDITIDNTAPVDTDGDGDPDATDPDDDNDGLWDVDEDSIGTDPLNPDSDDDGYSDGDEVDAGTDPLDPATHPSGAGGGGGGGCSAGPIGGDGGGMGWAAPMLLLFAALIVTRRRAWDRA